MIIITVSCGLPDLLSANASNQEITAISTHEGSQVKFVCADDEEIVLKCSSNSSWTPDASEIKCSNIILRYTQRIPHTISLMWNSHCSIVMQHTAVLRCYRHIHTQIKKEVFSEQCLSTNVTEDMYQLNWWCPSALHLENGHLMSLSWSAPNKVL